MTTHAALLALLFPAALAPQAPGRDTTEIPCEVHTLANGLRVVLHEDHSDPVVAVYVGYHVGSGREEAGRSGFAHLFEHMLFQGSQHVGDDQHFKLVQEAGGTLNGNTTEDRTVYFETLPANQLELGLWLEADRMGFLLPAMTQAKLDNQRDVVKNERRQNYENRPYGRVPEVLAAALYPSGHPYSWPTIGSMADLSAASLEDVQSFFRRWYGPNNAVLAVGGDLDPKSTLALIEKYFGSIPAGPRVDAPKQQPVELASTRRAVMEDKVTLPQLTLTWPAVARYAPEDAALDLLSMLLTDSRSSLLTKALTVDRVRARSVRASNDSAEIAGSFGITVQAAPGVTLDELENEILGLLDGLKSSGVSADSLQRMKNRYEASYQRRQETVGARMNQIVQNTVFSGNPNQSAVVLKQMLATTPQQVQAALAKYVCGRPYLAISVVPEGRFELAASGRNATQLAAEAGMDRKQKPGAGPRPAFRAPEVWHAQMNAAGGKIAVVGARSSEVPMTTLSIAIPGGRRAETLAQLGISSLCASLMNEGTRALDTTQFADAVDFLGASLNVGSGDDETTINLTVLDKHLPEAVALLGQVLLEPRFSAEDFARLKKQRLTAIDTRGESPRTIAANVWARLLYGAGTIDGSPSSGTRATVDKLGVEDVKDFYARHMGPDGTRVTVVSALDSAQIQSLLAPVFARWKAPAASVSPAAAPRTPEALGARAFLVDKPGAAQSEIRLGHMSVSSLDPDYYPLNVLNQILGGSFTSRINLNLREKHGYTYGARTSVEGGLTPGALFASTGVKTEVTKESVVELVHEMQGILEGPSATEVDFAKDSLSQAMATAYESSGARRGMLDNIAKYGWPDDYASRRLQTLEQLDPAGLKALAGKHVHPDRMLLLVVGDKAKIASGLSDAVKELGFGELVELDIDGNKR